MITDITTIGPAHSREWAITVAQSRIVIALDELWKSSCEQLLDGLELCVNPTKCRFVRATRDFPPHGINLVPLTNVISWKKEGETIPKTSVVIDFPMGSGHGSHRAVLVPMIKLPKAAESARGGFASLKAAEFPCIVPFWFVGQSIEVDKVTLVAKFVSINGLKVPVFHNPKTVKAGTELTSLAPPVEKKAAAEKGKGKGTLEVPQGGAPAKRQKK